MSSRVSRRAAVLGSLAAATALSGCGSPAARGLFGVAPPEGQLSYWNMFTGGDGANMVTMQEEYLRTHPDVRLDATVLAWGTPYYTKLTLATSGGAPPDVAAVHLSRLQTLAQADLLQPLDESLLGEHDLDPGRFVPAAVQKSRYDGRLHAVPLDTHPFVLFYNVDVCRRAGLLGSDGKLRPIRGPEQFRGAIAAAARVTGGYGGVVNITKDPSTNWRWFATLYYQLGGSVVADNGTRVTLDDDLAAQALSFMQGLTTSGLMPKSIDGPGVTSLFSTGKVGFLLDGEWQIPTYAGSSLKFDVVPVPHVFGPKPVAYADSHALVLPRNAEMDDQRRGTALDFVRSLIGSSVIWAKGGHIPAWLPVQNSAEFRAMRPQANYTEAARTAQYDPPTWYSGAGSQLQNLLGAAIATSQTGSAKPTQAVREMRKQLDKLAAAKPPVE